MRKQINIARQTKKIVFSLFVILLTFSFVSAINQETYSQMNFVDQLKYQFSSGGFFIFTSWGQQNDCSVNPDKETYITSGNRVDCTDYCDYDKCALDIFKDPFIYLGTSKPSGYPNNPDWSRLTYVKEVSGENAYYTFPSTSQFWYIQYYCCPEDAPITPTHETIPFQCINGAWVSYRNYGANENCPYDTSGVNRCWCSDVNERFYIDNTNNVHCALSPTSSWCPSCVSQSTSKCYSGNIYWYDSCGNRGALKENCPGSCATGASSCYNIVCGDGTKNGAEQCDDGNNNNLDGCSSDCKTETCVGIADIDCNGIVSRAELGTIISKWIAGTATRADLGQAIQGWATG